MSKISQFFKVFLGREPPNPKIHCPEHQLFFKYFSKKSCALSCFSEFWPPFAQKIELHPEPLLTLCIFLASSHLLTIKNRLKALMFLLHILLELVLSKCNRLMSFGLGCRDGPRSIIAHFYLVSSFTIYMYWEKWLDVASFGVSHDTTTPVSSDYIGEKGLN